MFSKIEIVPRWVIFAIDLCLCVVALVFAKILKKNFDIFDINLLALYKSVIITMLINSVVFYGLKTYSGIVRFTSAQDTFRILQALLIGAVLLFFTNTLAPEFGYLPFVSNVVIVIYTLFSFLFLMIYRVLVKNFFMYVKNSSLTKLRVIIYGAGEAGIATKRMFDHDAKVNKQIIAFVDDDARKVGKTIEGKKILAATSLDELVKKHELDEIIFASYSIPADRKNQIVDMCLEHDIKILNIPPADVWAKGKVSVKQIQNINIEDLLNRKPIKIDTDGIQSELKNKRILITGAAGSIGSEIVT
jgi:FlaA1/EpsC-like NDP-sugar epimerase